MKSHAQSAGRFILVVSLMAVMNLPTLKANQLATGDALSDDGSPRDSGPSLTGDEIFSKLLEHNHLRDARLRQYSVTRTYLAKNRKGKVYAEQVVRMEYRARGTKTFETIREVGSSVVRGRVFKGLMESEVEAAAGRSHRDSSITPANYSFRLVGVEDTEQCQCYVVQAVPNRKDKYLFAGEIWIDARDFAVVKIAGHPAKNPSFWIKRVDFVRSYQKVGEFWLPLRDETNAELKIFGEKVLIINHGNYAINEGEPFGERAQAPAGDGLPSDFSKPAGRTAPGETPRGGQE